MSAYDTRSYAGQAAAISLEIERKLMVLGLDWRNPDQMRTLAAQLLKDKGRSGGDPLQERARREILGLVQLMNTTMAGSAKRNLEVHGTECWKSLSRAMWAQTGH